jgi:hypothetical protein
MRHTLSVTRLLRADRTCGLELRSEAMMITVETELGTHHGDRWGDRIGCHDLGLQPLGNGIEVSRNFDRRSGWCIEVH